MSLDEGPSTSKARQNGHNSNGKIKDNKEESDEINDPTVLAIWKLIQDATAESIQTDEDLPSEDDSAMEGIEEEEDEFENENGDLNGDRHRRRKQLICKGCGLMRSHCAHGFCGSCYIREKIKAGVWTKENQRLCVHCNEIKRHYARNLCRNCYQKVVSRPHQKIREQTGGKTETSCVECGQVKELQCRGMCHNCYYRVHMKPKKKLDEEQAKLGCADCGEITVQLIKGQCEKCRKTSLMQSVEFKNGQLKICNVCNEIKKPHCGGMCQNCYKKLRTANERQKELDRLSIQSIPKNPGLPGNFRECASCHQVKKHEARGLCGSCYQRLIVKPKLQNQQPSSIVTMMEKKPEGNMRVCNVCKVLKKHCCRGMCQQCYYLQITKKKLLATNYGKNPVSKSDSFKYSDIGTSSDSNQNASMSNEEMADFLNAIQTIITETKDNNEEEEED